MVTEFQRNHELFKKAEPHIRDGFLREERAIERLIADTLRDCKAMGKDLIEKRLMELTNG